MIINNVENKPFLKERINHIEKIFKKIKLKHVFISGSYLYKEKYNDIDVFIISRKKGIEDLEIKGLNIHPIDFNNLHSLFYHSITKSCISKSFLPKKDLKVTITNYWEWINETIPMAYNFPKIIKKESRSVVLYTEYLKTGKILSSKELNEECEKVKDLRKFLEYININVPFVINKHAKKSYIKRYFYNYSKFYKDNMQYNGCEEFIPLIQKITRGKINGEYNFI
jgi:hypothetical protein